MFEAGSSTLDWKFLMADEKGQQLGSLDKDGHVHLSSPNAMSRVPWSPLMHEIAVLWVGFSLSPS